MTTGLDAVDLPLSDAERTSLTRILANPEAGEAQISRLKGYLGRYVHCDGEAVDWVQLAQAVLRRD